MKQHATTIIMNHFAVVVLRIYLSTRSGKMVKENVKRKTVGKPANRWRLHAIVVVEKVIGLVLFIRQKHLINLYQESLKNKKKKIETNFVDDESDDYIDMTHLDVADFFADPNGKIDHLIGDGSVSK
ncbi:UNVERIFIED_CONTAM: hypothetical protein Sradi_2631200 [Sesamum radiatum]|uniref:Uncharacterized protein n=1 Tax=Sesamum radiatum TaxID=300843 RepID=A0AAW2S4T7_SESRA